MPRQKRHGRSRAKNVKHVMKEHYALDENGKEHVIWELPNGRVYDTFEEALAALRASRREIVLPRRAFWSDG